MLRKLIHSAAAILVVAMVSLGVNAQSLDASEALQTWVFRVEGMT